MILIIVDLVDLLLFPPTSQVVGFPVQERYFLGVVLQLFVVAGTTLVQLESSADPLSWLANLWTAFVDCLHA